MSKEILVSLVTGTLPRDKSVKRAYKRKQGGRLEMVRLMLDRDGFSPSPKMLQAAIAKIGIYNEKIGLDAGEEADMYTVVRALS